MTWIFDNNYLKIFAIDMGIQWTAWGVASFFQTEKFYDITGSATFIALSYLSQKWSNNTTRQVVQSNMVTSWACRLGLYLFVRILKDGKDKRFDNVRNNPARFFSFWTIQGVWVFVTLLPTLMLNNSSREKPIGTRDYVGWSLYAIGMIFEVIADYQKTAFKNDPNNKDKFITSGLWSISRHPNYFGEILLWYGLFLSASSVFKDWQFLSVLSPMFVHFLITKISGIPLLEKAGMKKWGHLTEYQNYLKNTASLVPFFK